MRGIAFVDYENIWMSLMDKGLELTPELLIQGLDHYAQQENVTISAIYLYANFDREEFWRTQTSFEKTHVYTRHVYGKNNFSNTHLRHNSVDIELILEAQEILLTRASTFDVILLFTGDGDFLPLIRKIRAWGKEIKVVGVNGSIHQVLKPFCHSLNTLEEFLPLEKSQGKITDQEIEQGIQILSELQLALAYVASTKARSALGEKLGKTTAQVKELIRFLIKEQLLREQEYPDPGLKIGKTKIYLLNLDHATIQRVLGNALQDIRVRQERLVK